MRTKVTTSVEYTKTTTISVDILTGEVEITIEETLSITREIVFAV